MSLRKKTVSGLMWTFTQQFSVQWINFLVSIVLARILSPAEFGLIAMLSIFMAIGNTLMDSGLTSSLIRTPNPDERDYSTVFFINLVGSVAFYLILFFTAPLIADFYNQAILENIVRVYSLSFIIRAFVGVQSTRLTKAMDFKTQMMIQIPSVIGGGVLGVVLAHFFNFGVWSLVYMNLFQVLLSTVQHWLYSGWRPKLMFDKERFKYHFNFGYKMTLSGILNTLYLNLYTIIIGKFFSATQVGFYSRAYSLRQLPVQNISTALNKVTYPMFSSINHDDKKLKTAYKKVLQQVLFWIAPTLICLTVLAEPVIRFLLTEKWLPVVPYLQILAIAGIYYPLQSYSFDILKVKGRSDLHFKVEVIKKIYVTIGVFCAIPFGIYGLLYLQIITNTLSYYVNTYYSGRLINYPMKEQIKDVIPILGISIFSGLLTWLLDSVLVKSFPVNDFSRIVIGGVFYFLIYLGFSNAIKLPAIVDFRHLVLKR